MFHSRDNTGRYFSMLRAIGVDLAELASRHLVVHPGNLFHLGKLDWVEFFPSFEVNPSIPMKNDDGQRIIFLFKENDIRVVIIQSLHQILQQYFTKV